jgi:hypothetical protein
LSGLTDFAQDVEWPIGRDFDADPRIAQIAGVQRSLDIAFQLGRGFATGLNLADQRQADIAAAIDLELAREIFFIVNRTTTVSSSLLRKPSVLPSAIAGVPAIRIAAESAAPASIRIRVKLRIAIL